MTANISIAHVPRSGIGIDSQLVSPKQSVSRKQRDWYPYYAAFPEAFVENVLTQHLHSATSILDPWSGSGTTTAVCIKHGLDSEGVDINPSLTVIARARLLPASKRQELIATGETIALQTLNSKLPPLLPDPLNSWLEEESTFYVRALQHAIHETYQNPPCGRRCCDFVATVDSYSRELCFYYTALFSALRTLLSNFRSTNPTWIKVPNDSRQLVLATRTKIVDCFQHAVHHFADLLSTTAESSSTDSCPGRRRCRRRPRASRLRRARPHRPAAPP